MEKEAQSTSAVSHSSSIEEAPEKGAAEKSPFPATDRLVVWACVLITFIITLLRIVTGEIFDRVLNDTELQEAASEIEESAIVELSVWIGIVLSVLLSIIICSIYFSLCAILDEKVMPKLIISLRVNKKGEKVGIGASLIVGILCTIPVQIVVLLLGVLEPNSSIYLHIYLLIVWMGAVVWIYQRLAVLKISVRRRVIASSILATTAILSLLV